MSPLVTPGKTTLHVELANRLVDIVIEDPRIQALWIEADSQQALRRPFGPVTIHAVASEPDFPALVGAVEEILIQTGAEVENPRWSDTPRHARQLDAEVALEVDGNRLVEGVTLVIECAAFLAKRPRRAVVPLVDKTTHLTHVMSFLR